MALRLKKEKLDSFRQQLLKRRSEIFSKLSQATQDHLNEETGFTDTIDQATADADRTLAMQIKDREHDAVHQIDTALAKLDEGSYGICESCDEDIAPARMKAFPLTTLCIDCKAELESESRRYPSRIA